MMRAPHIPSLTLTSLVNAVGLFALLAQPVFGAAPVAAPVAAIASGTAFGAASGTESGTGIAEDGPDSGETASDGEKKDAPTEAKEPAATKPDRYLAITGGTIHTVSGSVLHNARIVAKNGRIEAIGPHISIPEGAEVIDATGHHVYPGLIAVRSVGLLGGDAAEDSTNVFTDQMAAALAGGITTAVSGNGAYKLLFGTLEGMIVGENLFVTLGYSTSNPSDRRRTREMLDRLVQHQRDLEAFELAKRRKEPDAKEPDARWIRGRAAELLRLLKGEAVATATADGAHDLLQLAELAEQYGITVVVRSANEGWVVAPQMSRANMRAIVVPRQRVDRDERLNRPNGTSIQNAQILHEHGVPIAIVPASPTVSFGGLGGRDLMHLRLEAAFAVRGGMSNQAALRAITLDAARIIGIDHRVGSIDVGKDADFVITDGDILHYMTHARWTVVNGRVMYDKQKDSLFDHIRPDGDQSAPPPDDHWPRRLGDPF